VARRRLRLPSPARLGLRLRITIAFAASTALLAALLAGTTWGLTRENLLNQREAAAIRQANLNSIVMSSLVDADARDEPIREALGNLATPTGARPIVEVRQAGGGWRSIPLLPTVGAAAIPDALRRSVTNGEAARMRVDIDGEPELVVGIPVNDGAAAYYEVVSLTELERTLSSLAVSLVGGSVVTTLVGGTLGYWLSRRTLRPLANVSLAAEAIAGGRLDTRLEGVEDPDLNVLVSSFNHMAQALEDRIDRDGRFASDVSHELRSPLMTLAASVSVLASRRGEMPDDPARAAVDLMEADVNRFQQLVDDLLEISRFDAGVARLSLEEVRLPELVRQAVRQHRGDRPDVPVELDADLAGMVVRADKRRLVRILDNLLGNADAYGGGPARVAIESGGPDVLIAVEDDGPGVPAEERHRIFERFSRGPGAGRLTGGDGVGLGLALVAEHARLHGGRVWVEDRPEGRPGARFVVALPVLPA